MSTIDAELSIPYVAGLVDSCGQFTVAITQTDESVIGHRMEPLVRVSKSDDTGLIDDVSTFLDAHDIRHNVGQNGDTDLLTVQSLESIERLVGLLEPYLVATLEPAVILVEEIIPRYRSGVNRSERAFYETMGLVDRLGVLGTSSRERTYTQAYFAELWDIAEDGATDTDIEDEEPNADRDDGGEQG